jgi:hypothetical protein
VQRVRPDYYSTTAARQRAIPPMRAAVAPSPDNEVVREEAKP